MHPVSFVGAGPGAPDLLTLRAAERLKQADRLIWTDSLINPAIAQMAPAHCKQVKTSTLTLEQVIPELIEGQRKGERVVRLHDGDPSLYSAINEQICALNDAEIPVEVIPGISAYQVTASTLGCELTIPGVVQTIVLSRTGGRTGVPASEELKHLSALKASLCLYLSARHVDHVQATLEEHYPSDTPVAIGYRVSWPDEQITVVPLNEMAATSRSLNLIRTTLYVVSPALSRLTKRSKLYSPEHDHLFRPAKSSKTVV